MEEKDHFLVMLDVPGADEDKVEVEPGEVPGTLRVRVGLFDDAIGEGRHLVRERPQRATIERVVAVAWDADVARAEHELKQGRLRVTVPRRGAHA